MIIYETTVIDVGPEVKKFAEKGMLVTFAEKALITLKDYSYYIERSKINGEIGTARKLLIDGSEYTVIEIGSMVKDNLETLGHVTISFKEEGDCLPGSICVEKAEVPALRKGSRIQILSE